MKYLFKVLKVIALTLGIGTGCVCLVLIVALLAKDNINNPFAKIEMPDEISAVFGVTPTTVDGISVEDYEKDAFTDELMKRYQWDLKISGDGIELPVADVVSQVVKDTVDLAYENPKGEEYQITIPAEAIDTAITEVINTAVEEVSKQTQQNELMTYNAEKDEFEFNDIVIAPEIDVDKLRMDLKAAIDLGEYTRTIEIKNSKEAEITKADQFGLIGTYQTKAVKNSNRNVNIDLACKTINGTILQPDEPFSYNGVLGPRTTAKGYKEAGVYLNGEHTTGIGGGICQLSSTLYNAIFAANLKVTNRTGHTFEPTYVRPGLDATVSYDVPEFSFVNDSGYPVGISCHFEEQIVTVNVYGVSTLDEGVTRYMRSERTGSIAAPAIIYQDNPDLLPAQEVVVRNGYGGSQWATYEVLEKDGEVISDTYIYTTKYKGEAPIVQRNFLYW